MALITIFTSPKPFNLNRHIDIIQRNTVRSLTTLGSDVEFLFIGNEAGMAEVAAEYGVRHIPEIEVNSHGTPLVSSIFSLARHYSSSPMLGCINADNLVMSDFVEAARRLIAIGGDFLAVGRRWDVNITTLMDFSPGWEQALHERVLREGRLRPPTGSEFFIFPRDAFRDMPAFAMGRSGWDNWMIYWGRRQGWNVVDVTPSVTVAHQDHDYSHLPGNKPPYRLPETRENIRLAGGKRSIFSADDASCQLVDGRLNRLPLTWKRFWREVEIYPLVKLHSRVLSELSYGLLHPLRAYREWRPKLAAALRRPAAENEREKEG